MSQNYKEEQHGNRAELHHGLTQANPWEIEDRMIREWDKQVRVQIASPEDSIVVPEGWHGAGKRGDTMVLFGDLLTKNWSGTELTPLSTLTWLQDKGFTFENDTVLTTDEAARIIASDETHVNGMPIVRAVRIERGVPMIIEVFHGSKSREMTGLSTIGNMKDDLASGNLKEEYRNLVKTLMAPFVSVGTSKAKIRMGIEAECRKVRRIDDCTAALTTFAADMAIDDQKGVTKPDLDENGVAVATTHSIVGAVSLNEKRNVPLLFRIGAPSFGLLAPPDTNYMANTQPDMLQVGPFTSGDFGTIMSTGMEQYENPHIRLYGQRNPRNITRLFLNGGGPILTIMSEQAKARQRPYDGIVEVLRASRIDNGPQEWGVIFSGKNLPNIQ